MEKVFQILDGYREKVIDLEAELTSRIAIGPESGGSGEHEKANYIKGILEAMEPDDLEEIRAPDMRARHGYRPNLVARWQGEIGAPTIWVLSHMDVVPPGDLSLWESEPHQIKVSGDRIIGRGVEDNQHGIISSVIALKSIREAGMPLKNTIGLAMVADEETGSSYGLDYVLGNRMDLFRPQDLIIVPDGGNEDGTMIEVAEKSMLWIKFVVTGKQCHGSTPEKGKNSLYGAARLIVEMESLKETYNLKDPLFRPPSSTFEPTKIEANVPNINTIPGRDVFYMDCRILPDYGVDDILNHIKDMASKIGKKLGLDILVEPTYRQVAALPTSPDARVVKALTRALKEVTGKEAKPMGIGGGTVAAFFRRAGLPAAVWLSVTETAHQPNEYVLITHIIRDAKVMAYVYGDEH